MKPVRIRPFSGTWLAYAAVVGVCLTVILGMGYGFFAVKGLSGWLFDGAVRSTMRINLLYPTIFCLGFTLVCVGADINREYRLKVMSAKLDCEYVEPGDVFRLRFTAVQTERLSGCRIGLAWLSDVRNGRAKSLKYGVVEYIQDIEQDDREGFEARLHMPFDSERVNGGFFWLAGRFIQAHRYMAVVESEEQVLFYPLPVPVEWEV